MMNVLEVQDNLKNFSQDQLVSEMQSPSGQAPQFLVLSELSRRKKMTDDLNKRMAENQPTVAEEAINAAGVPQQGIMQMAQAMNPKSSIAQNSGISAMQGGGVIKAQNSLPLGIRNFNPGNLRSSGDDWLGMTDDEGDYLSFKSPEYGLRALARNLGTYQNKHGINTIDSLVDRYAPSGDNPEDSRSNYKSALSDILGVGINEEFDIDANLPNLMEGIIKFENENQMPYSEEQIGSAIQAAGTDDATEVASLLLPSNYATAAIKDVQPKVNWLPGFEEKMNRWKKEKRKPPIGRDELSKMIENNLENKLIDADADPNNPEDWWDESKQLPEDQLSVDDIALDYGGIKNFFWGEGGYRNRPLINDNPNKIKEKPQIIDRSLLGDYKSGETGLGEGQDSSGTDADADAGANAGAGKNQGSDFDFRPDDSKTSNLEQQILNLMERRQKNAETDKWLALAKTGLAIMGSDSPTLAGAIGEGGVAGLDMMADANQRYEEGLVDLINAQSKLNKGAKSLTPDQALSHLKWVHTLQSRHNAAKQVQDEGGSIQMDGLTLDSGNASQHILDDKQLLHFQNYIPYLNSIIQLPIDATVGSASAAS